MHSLTMKNGELSAFMPLKLKKRSGRKMILAPDGVPAPSEEPHIDSALLKALIKAHLWDRQIKSGKFRTMSELGEHNGITKKYVQMIMRLNFLAPKIKEAIIFGTAPRGLKLADLISSKVPALWCEQGEMFGIKI